MCGVVGNDEIFFIGIEKILIWFWIDIGIGLIMGFVYFLVFRFVVLIRLIRYGILSKY